MSDNIYIYHLTSAIQIIDINLKGMVYPNINIYNI